MSIDMFPDAAIKHIVESTEHRIHDRLPSGFAFANQQQAHEFEVSGSVHGASKVCLVLDRGPLRSCCFASGVGVCDDAPHTRLAVRLRPPRTVYDIKSPLGYGAAVSHDADPKGAAEWYITQYNLGWQASTRVSRTGHGSEAWDSGTTNYAWDDGYLDNAAGRPKWHLTYCRDHDTCGEG